MERMITPGSGRRRFDEGTPVTLADRANRVGRSTNGLDPGAAIMRVLKATAELRSRLDSYERVLLVGLDLMQCGAGIGEVIETLPADDRRMGEEVAVTELFEARRTLRRALVAGLLADGLSVEGIAATFRVSVQGVSAFPPEVAHLVD